MSISIDFSALQRAENSSILPASKDDALRLLFQCSSASRKFLNFGTHLPEQRQRQLFQCSSASRKFLNLRRTARAAQHAAKFQCSSASRKFLNWARWCRCCLVILEFQCSSASRKFLNCQWKCHIAARKERISVLFSEPKIPQFNKSVESGQYPPEFQCSSASRKFLNFGVAVAADRDAQFDFSALQRAENSSIVRDVIFALRKYPFQCSSASRKFLNCERPQR